MRLVILPDPQVVASWVASYVKKRILAFAPTPDRPFVLGLPTGSSPLTVYKKLVEYHKKGELSFANVITFNMDEYCGLEKSHPQSYHWYMWECVSLLIKFGPHTQRPLTPPSASLSTFPLLFF